MSMHVENLLATVCIHGRDNLIRATDHLAVFGRAWGLFLLLLLHHLRVSVDGLLRGRACYIYA